MKTKILEIEEFYWKKRGIVFRYWRYKGEKGWKVDKTPYKEKPYKNINIYDQT